uniref:Pyruvate kinase n=1 Tax=Solanum lycopersicum TaxID=4081 RepID=A0A3Q7IMV7_SOLLC
MAMERGELIYKIYRALTYGLSPLIQLHLRWRKFRGLEHPLRWRERLGVPSLSRPPGPLFWFHAVSLGNSSSLFREGMCAIPVIKCCIERRPDVTVLMTTTTTSAFEVIKHQLPNNVLYQFSPVDTPGAIDAFLCYWKPSAIMLMESELWPNLIIGAAKNQIALALLNARISAKSYDSWSQPFVNSLTLLMLSKFLLILPLAIRFQLLQCPPFIINFCGDLKYGNIDTNEGDQRALEELQVQLMNRKIWMASSIHKGEEKVMLGVHSALKQVHPDIITIIVPRHPQHGKQIALELEKDGVRVALRSRHDKIMPGTNIYVVDTLGELQKFYRLTPIAVIGGSFLPGSAGHNISEAAAAGCAILTGPYIGHFSHMATQMQRLNPLSVLQVSGYILVEALSNLLSDAKLLEERQEAAKQAYHSLSCGITENVWSFLDFHIFRVALANKGKKNVKNVNVVPSFPCISAASSNFLSFAMVSASIGIHLYIFNQKSILESLPRMLTVVAVVTANMHSNHLLLEEPIRMASILEPSKANFFPAMTKIVGTLGPKSRSVEAISACLKAGMSVARFDFSWGDSEYHQETLENLKASIKATKKLCAVMLDTVGAELQVVNKRETPISLKEDAIVTLTPHQGQEASNEVLPINFGGLAKAVKKGDTIFVGQYLFTGSETTSVWLEVDQVNGDDVICVVKNSATLAGSLFTLHASQVHIDMPTLTDKDKEVISTWGVQNKIDFISLSYTRHAEDVREAREFLSKLGDLSQTQIFAKIENVEGLTHFDEILKEADGIILSRGNLGSLQVFLFQKAAVHKCNMAGKPAVVTRVVDSMTDNLRPTRAEATDVANAVLDGTDAILLGAETLRGLYPVETISTVGKICAEAGKVFNQDLYFKKTVKFVGEPMTHLEAIASSAVRAAIKVKASVIICFTSSGRAARLIAKYRPTMPVLSVVIPRLKTNQLKWSFSGAFEARQSLIVRGLFPMLADPRHPAESNNATNESVLKVALDHGKASGVIKSHDRVVVCQKVGDASVVKIIELED